MLHVNLTSRVNVWIGIPLESNLAVASPIADEPDFLADFEIIFHTLDGQVVLTVELVQDDVEPLYVKLPCTETDQTILPAAFL